MQTPLRRAWLLTALWLGIIALESFFGSYGNTDRFVGPVLHFLLPALSAAQIETVHAVLRKCGHCFGYGVLSFLLYRSWWTIFRARTTSALSWRDMKRTWLWPAALVAMLCTTAVAGLDEWHQSFEPGRGPSIRDVALDSSAGLAIQVLIALASTSPKIRQDAESVNEPVAS